ncbi:hypothetical protein ES703_68343 [subsurface metagenome]
MTIKLEGKGLIFSPDFIATQDAITIIKKCRNYFSAVKVGNIMLYQEGINVIQRLKDVSALPVICDFKLWTYRMLPRNLLELEQKEAWMEL